MFLVLGISPRTTRLEAGEFHCPQCDSLQTYDRVLTRPFFTLFFIPIFPVGRASYHLCCRRCGLYFAEAVRNQPAPRPGERMLGQFFEELKTGTSVEVMRQKMVNYGLAADEADRVLEQMCGGHPRTCRCGQHFHPQVARCSHCGAELR